MITNALPTTNTIYRTLKVRGIQIGTGFLVHVEKSLFLVTAAHLISEEDPSIDVWFGGTWTRWSSDILLRKASIDLAVFSVEDRETRPMYDVQLSDEGLHYGQQVYFLGFPYGDHGEAKDFDDPRWVFPYVKSATVSMLPHFTPDKTLVLDGHNNVGFSGGPVCFSSDGGVHYICGMVLRYREEHARAKRDDEDEGVWYFQNAGMFYALPSGRIASEIKNKLSQVKAPSLAG